MAGGGAHVGHMAQLLKLGNRPVTEPGQFEARLFGGLPGLSAQMGQAGLALADPFAIRPVVIADQDPEPVPDQGIEGLFEAVRVDHENGDLLKNIIK